MKVIKKKANNRLFIALGAVINHKGVLNSVYEWQRTSKEQIFVSKSAERILLWCIEHYTEHKEAPGNEVLESRYYEAWEEQTQGGEHAEEVDTFRVRAANTWNTSRYKEHQLYDIVQSVLRRQQVLVAMQRVDGTSNASIITDVYPSSVPVSLSREPAYPSFFEDPDVGTDISKTMEPLFVFNDEVLDAFFDDSFAKATFSVFQAPEKRGKSQWLLECSCRAVEAKKRVMYFDAGDMTKDQIFVRYLARLYGRPAKKDNPQIVWNSLIVESRTEVQCDYDEVEHTPGISQSEANRGKAAYAKKWRNKFFSYNYPKGALTVAIIQSLLDKKAEEGKPIDVVVLDYADIIAPSKSKYQDNRHAVTEIWGDLRALSQTNDIALITATQADADSYNNDQHQGSFSESKTKNAYITAEFAIDKSGHDEHLYKISYLFRRAGSISKSIYVGADLSTSRPAVVSAWVPKPKKADRAPAGKIKKR